MRGSVGGLQFLNYTYTEDLANGADYTPPANCMFSFINEQGLIDSDIIFIEFFGVAGYIAGTAATPLQNDGFYFQNTGRSIRIANDSGVAKEIGCFGAIWS